MKVASGIRLMNIRNGRGGGAVSAGLVAGAAGTAAGTGADRDVRNVPIETAAPIAVTTTAAIAIHGFETWLTALSCHRPVGSTAQPQNLTRVPIQ